MHRNYLYVVFSGTCEATICFSILFIALLMEISIFYSVRKQVVNIPSFIVRLDSQKHIDFSLKSPFGGGRPGRVKRKNLRKGTGGGAAEEEED